ncbi:MAG TPA: pantoate--beta-alanine ligase [Thermoguttaceae bacterium]|nr:pantoate--beta-alanine ligase [Thermoguttaceae bacterium]
MNDSLRLPRQIAAVAELRREVAAARREGRRIGLAPTMGALHEGHLSLVRASRAECNLTIVSIFVNPAQFAPGEDLDRYPRTLAADLEKLATCGTDVVAFVPGAADVYSPNHAAWIEVEGLSGVLEGEFRPTHFRGVATVVLKLFNMVAPDVAYFGQKDYQQVAVIRRMVADLDVPVEIRVCPTVRESDGLAMSSRNAYLSPDARRRATVLWKSLCLARELVASGERDAEAILGQMRDVILSAGDVEIDYVVLADADTLEPVAQIAGPTVALVAARIDKTRLIDNEVLLP